MQHFLVVYCGILLFTFHLYFLSLHTSLVSYSIAYPRKQYITSMSPCCGSKAQTGIFGYSLLDQKRRSNRRSYRKSKLHQVDRSPQSNKAGVFTPSIRIHHTGCMLGEFYYRSCHNVHAKSYANAVLSAAWQSSSFVWRDSCAFCILWQLFRWEQYTK